jgi:hypothetical protein
MTDTSQLDYFNFNGGNLKQNLRQVVVNMGTGTTLVQKQIPVKKTTTSSRAVEQYNFYDKPSTAETILGRVERGDSAEIIPNGQISAAANTT